VESIKNAYAAGRGKRKSRNGAKSKRGGIPGRVDISERPAIADQKLFQEIHPDKRKTFTCDNGKEFCGHQELSQKLGADFYFATPYHSWERGLNEHTKGLLRQFFPKGTNFKILKPEEVERAVNLINKCETFRHEIRNQMPEITA